MKRSKLLILCLVIFMVMGSMVIAQKGDKAQKIKKKVEHKMAKVHIKGLDKLKNLEIHLDGLAERLECLRDLKVDIDMSGLRESLQCLENLKDIEVHLHGLEALEALEYLDFDIDIPEIDINFDFDFDDFFECAKKSKSSKSKKAEKAKKKIKKKK